MYKSILISIWYKLEKNIISVYLTKFLVEKIIKICTFTMNFVVEITVK